MKLTPEFIRSILSYEPLTGDMRWKIDRPRGIKAGMMAGSIGGGRVRYRSLTISGKKYLAHRLAFVIMTGRWPTNQVDHKSKDSTDNRWKNLREASSYENQQNRSRYKSNKIGYKGVSRHASGRYIAQIEANGIGLYLGLFREPEHAAAAYRIAAACVHGKFARTE